MPYPRPRPLTQRHKYERYSYRARALLWAIDPDQDDPPCPLAALYRDMFEQATSLFLAEYAKYAQEEKPGEARRQRLDGEVGECLLVPRLRRKLERALRGD